MKKSVLLIAIAILGMGSSASAQEYWNFGIKGGLNFSTITGDYFESPKTRTGLNFGVLAEIPVSDKFSIQPEVLYSAQGYDFASIDEDNIFDNDDNIEYQVDYISVPVLAEFYVLDGLSIQAGPSFNFKVNEELDYQPRNDAGDINKDRFDSFGLNGVVGLEYKLNSGLFFDGRYNYGFTEVYENSGAHNSIFQVGLGFMF